jgi:glycosyltransferase involved in cell wall biosynthesis/O-antigen ligase
MIENEQNAGAMPKAGASPALGVGALRSRALGTRITSPRTWPFSPLVIIAVLIALVFGIALGKLDALKCAAIVGALAMMIIIALRQDRLAAALIIMIHLYADWYLGMRVAALGVALVLLSIILLARSPHSPMQLPRALWLWIIFLALGIPPALRGVTWPDSTTYYLDIIFGALVMFWLGTVIAQNAACIRRLFQILAACATLLAIITIIQTTTGVLIFGYSGFDAFLATVSDFQLTPDAYRVGAFFVDPNWNGTFFAMMAFLPLGLLFESRLVLEKILYLGETFLMLLALLFTYSTGAWIATFAGLLVFIVLVGRMSYRVLLISLVVMAALVIIEVFPTQISLQIQHATDPTDLMTRLAAWETAIVVMRAFPWSGLGLGIFAYRLRAIPYSVLGPRYALAHPHNSYLEIGAMAGIPVLALFVALLLLAFWWALRNWAAADVRTRALLGGGIAAVAALSVNSLSINAWTLAPLASAGWLLLGALSTPLLARNAPAKTTPIDYPEMPQHYPKLHEDYHPVRQHSQGMSHDYQTAHQHSQHMRQISQTAHQHSQTTPWDYQPMHQDSQRPHYDYWQAHQHSQTAHHDSQRVRQNSHKPARRLRVCVVVHAFPVIGGIRAVLTGVQQVTGDVWEIEYLTHYAGPNPGGLTIHTFGSRRMGAWQFPQVWLYALTGCWKLLRLMRARGRYDLLLPQDGVATGAFAALAAKLMGACVVCIDHGTLTLLHDTAYRRERMAAIQTWPWPLRLLACLRFIGYWPSQQLLARFSARLTDHFLIPGVEGDGIEEVCQRLGIPADRITRFGSMIDTQLYAPLDADARTRAREQHGIAADAIVIALTCRLAPEKGLDIALAAIDGLRTELAPALRDRLRVVIAGDGPLRSQVEAGIQACGLGEVCMLWGETPTDGVVELLGMSDIFLYTSTRGACLSMAVLEAMASGCAVVASTRPLSNAHLLAGGRGIAVSAEDVAQTRDALLRLVNDMELCTRMGRAAHDYVAVEHSAAAFRRILLRATSGTGSDAALQCEGKSSEVGPVLANMTIGTEEVGNG